MRSSWSPSSQAKGTKSTSFRPSLRKKQSGPSTHGWQRRLKPDTIYFADACTCWCNKVYVWFCVCSSDNPQVTVVDYLHTHTHARTHTLIRTEYLLCRSYTTYDCRENKIWHGLTLLYQIFQSTPLQSKKDGKDQETIRSSTTPDEGYHMGK